MLAFMIFLVFMTSILLSFSDCKSKNYLDYKNPVGINLIYSYPIAQIVDDKMVFNKLMDTIPIVYYKRYILYHLPKATILETDRKVQSDNTFFLYQRDSSYGYLFKSANKNFNKRLIVDSFLKQRAFGGATLQKGPNDTLIEVVKGRNGELVEKYVPRQNYDTYFDSLFFYYTNTLKQIDFSFSKKMDSLKSMKLYKVRLINNETFSHQYNTLVPKKEYFFKISKMTNDSLKNYIQIITKYSCYKTLISISRR